MSLASSCITNLLGSQHQPVLLNQVISIASHMMAKRILDATFGAGGHSNALLRMIPSCHLVAIDRDGSCSKIAERLKDSIPFGPSRFSFSLGRFGMLDKIQMVIENSPFDMILMDVGLCTDQVCY
jgi:16S rRNA (cytosine1402-N4)-methyltransferase